MPPIYLRLSILCLQLKVAFRLVFQTAFLIALQRSPIDRLSINSGFISGMINSSWFPRTFLVLTLKVLRSRKPLSSIQKWGCVVILFIKCFLPTLNISAESSTQLLKLVIHELSSFLSRSIKHVMFLNHVHIHLYSFLSLPSKAPSPVHFSPSLLILT